VCLTTGCREVYLNLRQEVSGGQRTLQKEDFHNLFHPPEIIVMKKSRRVKRERHVACKGEKRNARKFILGR
jgi:hypothetical protein